MMIQWIGVALALLGFVWNGVKDYQHGEIKLPSLPQKTELTKPIYPIQYCVMAYDPNVDKVFYQHENGIWYDFPPQQRRYSSSTQSSQTQNQGEKALGVGYGTQGASGYTNGQSAQATTNTIRR